MFNWVSTSIVPLTGAQCCHSICLNLYPPVLLHLEEGWGSLGLGFQMNQDGGRLSPNSCSPLHVWSEGMAVKGGLLQVIPQVHSGHTTVRMFVSSLSLLGLHLLDVRRRGWGFLVSCGLGRVWSGGEELDSCSRYSGPVADRGLVLEGRPLPKALLSYLWADLSIFPFLCCVFGWVRFDSSPCASLSSWRLIPDPCCSFPYLIIVHSLHLFSIDYIF